MTKLSGNITGYFTSTFRAMKRRIEFRKLLLVIGALLMAGGFALGQSCPSNPVISFNAAPGPLITSTTVNVCSTIGGGNDSDHTDIDLRPDAPIPGATQYNWQYSTTGTDPWTTDTYHGYDNYHILSFFSVPGIYYFRMQVITTNCPAGVYSNTIVLTVLGTAPISPTAIGRSKCVADTFHLTASNCTGTLKWFSTLLGSDDNVLGQGSPFIPKNSLNNPLIISTDTAFYVSCTTGSGINNQCESPRTRVKITIGTPATPGAITGPANVCPGQLSVPYSVPSVSGVTYNWSYSPSTEATITSSSNSATVSFSGSVTPGTLSVTATGVSGCGTSPASNLGITFSTLSAPTVGTRTPPTCATPTGSVILNGLPATGTWTLTRTPGGTTTTGTGTSTTVTGIPAGTTYTYTVTSSSGCISGPSGPVVIDPDPGPTPPTVGPITQPTCTSLSKGSVELTNLPSGNWTINPGAIPGNTSPATISGLDPGTYKFTVTNSSGCISAPSADVVINAAPGAPAAPTVGTITQPSCILSTGSVELTGLPTTGNWSINPGTITGSGTSKLIDLLAPATYNFTVTDALGCISAPSADVKINVVPSPPPAPGQGLVIQPSCSEPTGTIGLVGLPSGTWVLNMSPGGTLTWSGSAITLSGLAPSQTYQFTVTDEAGCTSSPIVSIPIGAVPSPPAAPTVNIITPPTCQNPTATIQVVPTTGYQYSIDNGSSWQGSSTFSGVSVDPHYVLIKLNDCVSPSYLLDLVDPPSPPATPTAFNNGPLCVGATLNLTTPTVVGASYSWTGPNSFSSALQNPSITAVTLAAAGTYNVTVTLDGCTSTAGSTPVVVNSIPTTPTASNNGPLCVGATLNLTTPTVVGATYSWTGPNSFSSILQNPSIAIITAANAGTYYVSITLNGCTSTAGSTKFALNPITPAPNPTVTQPICPSLNGTISLPGGYQYKLDGGNFSAQRNYSVSPGLHYILANGTCISDTTWVTINSPLTAAAGTITGTATVCQGQSGVAYSVPAIANATSYTWAYSGTGATINGTTNNITIDFSATATGGNLTVKGTNACGNGTVSANYAITVNPLPAAAGVITGVSPVCQGQSGVAYSVPAIANATSYTWAYSGTGATINGTTNNITIDFSATATGGNLTVKGTNACGNGTVSANYAITVNPLPAAAGVITGVSPVCQGQSGVAYSVPAIANATSYTWAYSGMEQRSMEQPIILR